MVGIQILCHACHASKKIWKDTQYEYDTPMQDSYIIRSNRESGYGRYDVILIPNDKKSGAYVLEFKVQDFWGGVKKPWRIQLNPRLIR